MRFKLFCACSILVLTPGCATVKFNGAETQKTQVNQPPIGEVAKAYVGDPLLQKGEVIKEKVLQVNKTIDGALFDIPQGVYRQVGYDDSATYYSANGVVKSALADPPKGLKLKKAPGSQLCVVTIYNGRSCYAGDYQRKTRISRHGKSFQQTLLYSGRVGNEIKVSYREFSNNIARPAFSNSVAYDLSASRIIGYKGAKIEVLKANNDSITYKVIRNFP